MINHKKSTFYTRKLKQKRLEEGRCIDCNKVREQKERVRCNDCLSLQMIKARERRQITSKGINTTKENKE